MNTRLLISVYILVFCGLLILIVALKVRSHTVSKSTALSEKSCFSLVEK